MELDNQKWNIKKNKIMADSDFMYIGYKVIGQNYEYIAKLGIPKDALTNIGRPDIVNPEYAKFRANKVYVLDIINRKTGEKINKEYSHPNVDSKKYEYEVESEIETYFDTNINNCCSEGIHFFLSTNAANSYADEMIFLNSVNKLSINTKTKKYGFDGRFRGYWIISEKGKTDISIS